MTKKQKVVFAVVAVVIVLGMITVSYYTSDAADEL